MSSAIALTHTPGFPPPRLPRFRFRLLRWIASFLPLREIRVEGRRYLERYYICGPIDDRTAALWPPDDRPSPGFLRRNITVRVWYLHRILAPDAERDPHDHPWDARGRILAGGYVEDRAATHKIPTGALLLLGNERVQYTEGDRTHVEPDKYHRISELVRVRRGDPWETWTLLRCAPVVKTWGYLTGLCHVDHDDYHAAPNQRRRAQ